MPDTDEDISGLLNMVITDDYFVRMCPGYWLVPLAELLLSLLMLEMYFGRTRPGSWLKPSAEFFLSSLWLKSVVCNFLL